MKVFTFVVLLLFCGCAQTVPPLPDYETPAEKDCGQKCQSDYRDCMQLDVRPDYLIDSPRKEACRKGLRECYQNCSAD